MKFHADYGKREFHFNLSKAGEPPMMPLQSNSVSGDTIGSTSFALETVFQGDQTNYVYNANGIYHFWQPVNGFVDAFGQSRNGLRGEPGVIVQSSDMVFQNPADEGLIEDYDSENLSFAFPYEDDQISYWPSKDLPANAFTADVVH